MIRWLLLCGILSSCLLVGCRDNTRACQQAARKYIQCMKQSHQLALKEKNASKSRKLLKKIGKRLESKDWETRYLRLCRKHPPSLKQLRCVKSTPCNKLSTCQNKPS